MRDESFITDQQYREAARSPLEARWHAMPSAAPHLAMHLAPYSQVQTTIDAKTQDHTRELTTYFLKQYDGKISNAAAVVIEVETSTILAYSGSADFFRSDGGQIDLARAVRSPGSALKPFVYAYAMQHDLVYPSEMLLDDVLDYGDYSPANFDGAFNGLITAADALRYSLNVPAVQLLERSGVSNVHATLQQLGLTTLDRAPSHYGLGLTLGNCGVRLDELAAAYASLANNGVYRSPQVVKDADAGLPKPVFDAAVAATILDLLRQPLPRELPHSLVQRHRALAPVAWKTGTSTGHRDAWAFVFNRQYVVGVWMGNPDGRPAEQLVGADAALPLAGALFRRLPAKDKPAWPELTQTHRMVLVCADSGLPRSTACDASIEVRLPRSMYTARRCDVHRSQITLAESIRRWPADARHWNLASIQNPIPLRGNAGHVQAALRITSPANDAEYVLTGKPSGDRIRLQASLEIDQQVHWYSNGHYLGMSDASTPQYLDLASGEHEIACMVENGATDSIRITVYDPRGGPGHPPGGPLQ